MAAEYHSMNKNQSLIKIRPVVPEKNAKMWEIFQTLRIGCRMPQHKQKSKFGEDRTGSSWEKIQKNEKILKPYHEPVVAEKKTDKILKPCHEPKITLWKLPLITSRLGSNLEVIYSREPPSPVGPLQAPIRPRCNLESLAHFSACTGWCIKSRKACPWHRPDLDATLKPLA